MNMQLRACGVLALGSALMVGCLLESPTDIPSAGDPDGSAGENNVNVAGKMGVVGSAGLGRGGQGGSANGNLPAGGAYEPPVVSGGSAGNTMPVPTPPGGAGGEAGQAGVGGEAGQGGADGSADVCVAETETDADNCGECGHSCLGGACKAGHCQPVELAKDQLQLQGLVADDTSVYWVTSSQNQTGKVLKVPFGGGTVVTLATNQPNPGGVVLDQGNLFWSNVYCCSSTINKVSIGGGTVTPVATGQAGPQGLTLFDHAVYWPNHVLGGALMSASTSGGAAAPVISNLDRPASIAVDATNIYWTEDVGGIVRKAPRTGGASTPLATGEKNPTLINVSPQYLYWINDTSMMRLPLAGGAAAPFQVQEGRNTLLSDTQNIYWGGDKGIKFAPHAGGAVQTLVAAADVGSVGHFWVDAKSVYWTDYKGGRVLRLAR